MPRANKEATLAALKQFREDIETSLVETGLMGCLLGANKKEMADNFTGILGVHIAEFGRSGLSRNMSIAMNEIETAFKGSGR